MGDPYPSVERTPVMGIALVHSSLNNRSIVQQCRTLWQQQDLQRFQFAVKWVPVDYWCKTDLEAMKRVIDTHLKDYVKPNQSWGMVVKKRRFQKHHTIDIVRHLARDVNRRVDLNKPDWIVWVDIIGGDTAITFLKPDEKFSVGLPCL
jgi:tRNA acetyltransferase TAN1